MWMALPMTTRIKKIVSRISRRYPAIIEITDRFGNYIVDDYPSNDDNRD